MSVHRFINTQFPHKLNQKILGLSCTTPSEISANCKAASRLNGSKNRIVKLQCSGFYETELSHWVIKKGYGRGSRKKGARNAINRVHCVVGREELEMI